MKIRPVKRDNVIIGYLMESPLTGDLYCFYTKESGKNTYWTFNNDYEKPTFRPSMMNMETGEHFFVTEGKVDYITRNGSRINMDMIDMD